MKDKYDTNLQMTFFDYIRFVPGGLNRNILR